MRLLKYFYVLTARNNLFVLSILQYLTLYDNYVESNCENSSILSIVSLIFYLFV